MPNLFMLLFSCQTFPVFCNLEDLVNQILMEVLLQHSSSGNPFTALSSVSSSSPKPAAGRNVTSDGASVSDTAR